MHTDTRLENLLRSRAHADKGGDGRTTRRWGYSSGSQSVVCKPTRAVMPGFDGGGCLWDCYYLPIVRQKEKMLCFSYSKFHSHYEVHLISGDKGQEQPWRYTSILSIISGLDRGWAVSATPWPLYPLERDPVPITQEAGWAPRPPWAGVKNLTTTWIRSSQQPIRSELLYRPNYPGPLFSHYYHSVCNELWQWHNTTFSRIQVCCWFVIIHLESTN